MRPSVGFMLLLGLQIHFLNDSFRRQGASNRLPAHRAHIAHLKALTHVHRPFLHGIVVFPQQCL